jgi:hypothetical protein
VWQSSSIYGRQNNLIESAMSAALLKDTSFSDFKIVCGGKTFDCHKCVLANQSDVLKTMLMSKDWSENQEDTLKIEDFKPDIIEGVNLNMNFKWK